MSASLFSRESINTGYTQIPHGLWTIDAPNGAKVLLGWLHSHSDEFLSSLTLNDCREAMKSSQVSDWLDILADLGFVRVVRSRVAKRSIKVILLADEWVNLPRKSVSRNRPTPKADIGLPGKPKSAHIEEQGENQGENQQPIAAQAPLRNRCDTRRKAEMNFGEDPDKQPPRPTKRTRDDGYEHPKSEAASRTPAPSRQVITAMADLWTQVLYENPSLSYHKLVDKVAFAKYLNENLLSIHSTEKVIEMVTAFMTDLRYRHITLKENQPVWMAFTRRWQNYVGTPETADTRSLEDHTTTVVLVDGFVQSGVRSRLHREEHG